MSLERLAAGGESSKQDSFLQSDKERYPEKFDMIPLK